jgi:ankyrin repeat protein
MCTVLQAVAEGRHLAVVERLLITKANVNAATARTNRHTVLQAAAEGGHLAVVKRLLITKADVNSAVVESNRITALQAPHSSRGTARSKG